MILCPNTGRKPWTCLCVDCVAVRLEVLPDPSPTPNRAAGFVGPAPAGSFNSLIFGGMPPFPKMDAIPANPTTPLGALVRSVLYTKPSRRGCGAFPLQVGQRQYMEAARAAAGDFEPGLTLWTNLDHSEYLVRHSDGGETILPAHVLDRLITKGKRTPATIRVEQLSIDQRKSYEESYRRLSDFTRASLDVRELALSRFVGNMMDPEVWLCHPKDEIHVLGNRGVVMATEAWLDLKREVCMASGKPVPLMPSERLIGWLSEALRQHYPTLSMDVAAPCLYHEPEADQYLVTWTGLVLLRGRPGQWQATLSVSLG